MFDVCSYANFCSQGTGAGCCYLPSVSMVAMYFTSKRSVAMGIAASGLGAGAFCMAPLLDWLVDYYGWRGCMLIIAGISLNMCVLGALMHPLRKSIDTERYLLHKNKDVRSVDFSSFHLDRECCASEKCDCKENCNLIQQEGCAGSCRNHGNGVYHQLPPSEAVLNGSCVSYFPVHPAVIYSHDRLSKSREKLSRTAMDTSENSDLSSVTLTQPELRNQLSQTIEPVGSDSCQMLSLSPHKDPRKKVLAQKVGGSMEVLASAKSATFPNGKLYSSQLEVRCEKQFPSPSLPVRTNKMVGLSEIQFMLAGSMGSLVFLDKTTVTMHNSSIILSSRSLLEITDSKSSIAKEFPVASDKSKDKKGMKYYSLVFYSIIIFDENGKK